MLSDEELNLLIIGLHCVSKGIYNFYTTTYTPWNEAKELKFQDTYEYRIKPEPKYRPFKDAKECWNEMQKHQPIGYTKLIGEIEYSFITNVDNSINYSDAIKEYTFADGTPFGIKEE